MQDLRATIFSHTFTRRPEKISRSLQAGDRAPSFELSDADLEVVSLEQFIGRCAVMVYFYPKDDTPGCRIEAIEFSERLDDFESAGATVRERTRRYPA